MHCCACHVMWLCEISRHDVIYLYLDLYMVYVVRLCSGVAVHVAIQ